MKKEQLQLRGIPKLKKSDFNYGLQMLAEIAAILGIWNYGKDVKTNE